MKILLKLAFLIALLIFPWLVLGPAGQWLESLPLRIAAFVLVCLIGARLARSAWSGTGWIEALLISTLANGVTYQIAAYLPTISTYPLSLGWSEVSRYYYASLFFSERLYGVALPTSVLHPSRYLMQGLPFIFPASPLWLHRLWQVILWIVFSLGTAALLAKRLGTSAGVEGEDRGFPSRGWRIGFILWAYLFLFQGPVYYHLLVMVILILWGYDRLRPWKTLAFVLVASAWAGISRVNWLPVPGLLAATLYLLECKIMPKATWRYLVPPVLWTALGTTVAFVAQQAYMTWSGNPPEQFGSSFTSDLLWYRLLPSHTYPLGILPSILLVSLPVLCLIAVRLLPRWRSYHFLRLAGLAAMLFVLFTGGVIVSLKIGGGSNLHNLDAYLVLLLVIASAIYFGRFLPDRAEPEPSFRPHYPLVAFAVIVPVLYAITSGGSYSQYNFQAAQEAIEAIRQTAHERAGVEGEVLMISQRHLLTFGELKGIALLPDYEKVFLMEMAMAANGPYLEAFHQDIQNQRYELIVSDPLVVQYQGRSHSFGEENDAWVRYVSEPVLCYYEPLITLKDVEVQLLTPRQTPCE